MINDLIQDGSSEGLEQRLAGERHRWLVTGGAGFIGSHLVEELLRGGQDVVVLDDFSTGKRENLEHVRRETGPAGERLEVREGDIRDVRACQEACRGCDYVLHEAALVSVPNSIADARLTHEVNATGTLNLLEAARDAGVRRFVYASSSAVYGNEGSPAKVETRVERTLSPYAASKAVCEVYASMFTECYGLGTVGLRYFNVFGPRQNPGGAYAAVIPLWLEAALEGKPIFVNGDGETTRDFIPVRQVVRANLLAALAEPAEEVEGEVFNVGLGRKVSLNDLIRHIVAILDEKRQGTERPEPVYREFRDGDVRHSLADVSKARERLGFHPEADLARDLEQTMNWLAGPSS